MAVVTSATTSLMKSILLSLVGLSLILLLPAHGFMQPSRSMELQRIDFTSPHPSPAVLTKCRNNHRLFLARYNNNNDNNDDDDDDDDDVAPDVDIRNFNAPSTHFSSNIRSAPNQRKAMSTKASSQASVHVCTNCAAEFVKWMGRCPTCREWNTLQEFKVERSAASSLKPRPSFGGNSGSSSSLSPNRSWLGSSGGNDNFDNAPIRVTDVYKEVKKEKEAGGDYQGRPTRLMVPNDDELNTVMGGGIMTGSLTLIGGDPGVGKSTLMLQTAGAIASLATPSVGIGMGPASPGASPQQIGPVWYISGEENAQQIASRAMRLGIDESELWLLTETHVDTLCEQVVASYHTPMSSAASVQQRGVNDFGDGEDVDDIIPGQAPKPPSLLVIDSIQTMICEAGGASAAGGVTQVRECVALFLRLAKSTGIPIVLVGHVTKNGDVAGPRTVEHMVDCVLYLEGGDYRTIGGVNLRMLRAAKNRFGSADEVGVYEMTTGRLMPVSDPSSLFLANRMDEEDSEGCAISLILEGLRAMTVEVQALVTLNMEGHGRRTVNGFPYPRVQLLLGVLQKRCGMFFGKQDVYVNVVGNMNLDSKNEGSGSDLAVSMALVSSLLRIPVRSDTAFIGEIGLLGELRPVPAAEKRLQEARRMGFSRVVSAKGFQRNKKGYKQSSRGGQPSFSRVDGMDWIQCDTLVEALNEGLVTRLPKRGRRKAKGDGSGPSPGSMQELMLNNDIIIDEEEEDDSVFD